MYLFHISLSSFPQISSPNLPPSLHPSLHPSLGFENLEALRQSVTQALHRCPRQTPAPTSIHFDSAMEGILVTAAQQAKKKGDAFLAADQILLVLVDHASVASACRQAGLAPEKVRGEGGREGKDG